MTQQAATRPNRLALVVLGIAVAGGLLYVARGALFPFILSGILAYLLYPIVRTLESWMPWRNRWPGASRVLAILLIYVAALAVLAGVLALTVPPTYRQATEFVDSVPELYSRARATVEGWSADYASRVPEDVRERIEGTLESGSSVLIAAFKGVVARTVGAVSNTLTTVIGLAIVPFFLFYLLKDREAAVEGFYTLLPPAAQRHTQNVIAIANQVLGAYVRAQLTLAVVVGTFVFLGLFLLGIKFSALLGLVAGFTELVPVIGPLLGAIPGVLVTLATSPGDLLWVVLLYVVIQLVENALLVPRIQSQAVDIHPAMIMVILVVSSEAAGLPGVIVGVPLAAVAKNVFRYFYDEWSGPAALPAKDEQPEEQGTEAEAVAPADDSATHA